MQGLSRNYAAHRPISFCLEFTRERLNREDLFCFSELRTGKLTVGKIYGGLLILENWKGTRFGQIPGALGAVSKPLINNVFYAGCISV